MHPASMGGVLSTAGLNKVNELQRINSVRNKVSKKGLVYFWWIIGCFFCMWWVSGLVLYFHTFSFALVFSVQYYCSLLVREVRTYSVRGTRMELSSQNYKSLWRAMSGKYPLFFTIWSFRLGFANRQGISDPESVTGNLTLWLGGLEFC